jgi:hypothetical protein
MATDLYVDGRRWRVRPSVTSREMLARLDDDFGTTESIYGLDVVDENGHEGVLRFQPSRLSSFAIIAVPDE